jgi:hypothetical protein
MTIGPTADDAGIKEIKTLLAWRVDLPIWFTDQHCLAVMDRDLLRSDCNLKRHDVFLRSRSKVRLDPVVIEQGVVYVQSPDRRRRCVGTPPTPTTSPIREPLRR